METKKLLDEFVQSHDNSGNIIGAFGYGSGVFKQKGYNLQKQPMIDMILVVNNPQLWHRENMKNNPNDYSISGKISLTYFDLNSIRKATGVTYQSNIEFMNNQFKYGIIGKDRFIDALNGDWDSFFIQRRFQKPILTIRSTEEIDEAIKKNRDLAIFVALLTLTKKNPTLLDLYYQICNLSYSGDIRMLFAENPNKIYNIVNGSFNDFFKIYGDHNQFFFTQKNGEIVINNELLYASLSFLPKILYTYLQKKGYNLNSPEIIAKLLQEKMSQVNRKDSIIQPLTGILTVGPIHSLNYLSQKIKKKTMGKSS